VRNDDGYEVAFTGREAFAQKVTYSDGMKTETVIGEWGQFPSGNKLRWGMHLALTDRYLVKWDDGSDMNPEERETLRNRFRASLDFMRIPHTIDRV
jgi:hypothetical protein